MKLDGAACADNPSVFYSVQKGGNRGEAKALCRDCDVAVECRAWTVNNLTHTHSIPMVLAGMTQPERYRAFGKPCEKCGVLMRDFEVWEIMCSPQCRRDANKRNQDEAQRRSSRTLAPMRGRMSFPMKGRP